MGRTEKISLDRVHPTKRLAAADLTITVPFRG